MEFAEANTPALDPGKTPADPNQEIANTAGYEFLMLPFSVAPTVTMKTDNSHGDVKDCGAHLVT